MEPVVTGALIGAGASLLGGISGSRSQRRLAREQLAYQREFAQHGVQWRVEDAARAGVHPLFALGANVPSYSPAVQVDPMGPALAQAGQQIGQAVSRTLTPEQKMAQQLALTEAAARIRESDARAGYYDSLSARERQSGSPGLPMPGPSAGSVMPEGQSSVRIVQDPPTVQAFYTEKIPGQADVTQVQPAKPTSVRSQDPSITAGPKSAMWTEYDAGGFRFLLPSKDASEPLETVGESFVGNIALTSAIIARNVAEYGPGWIDRAKRRVGNAGRSLLNEFEAKMRGLGRLGGEQRLRSMDEYGRR